MNRDVGFSFDYKIKIWFNFFFANVVKQFKDSSDYKLYKMVESTAPVTLTFREKIPRSNNNTILSVPNLTYRNLVLSQIDFMTEEWHFESVLKSAATDLVKMTTSFFQHQQSLDLSGYQAKIEEGDRLDLCIKPKQAPRDIELMICYTYQPSLGAIYYQSNERVMDWDESTLLVDISQGMRPTQLYVKCDEVMSSISLIPKFIGEDASTLTFEPNDSVFVFDFGSDEFSEILPLLKHYDLKVTMENNNNLDAQIYYLARGFKN